MQILMEEENHCEKQPTFCPGKEGKDVAYHYEFSVFEITPLTGGVLKIQLFTQTKRLDDSGRDYVVCAELPAKFVE